jgi:hypothetical protein
MHVLSASQFLTTLVLSIITTALVSRVLLLMLGKWQVGIGKIAVVNGASFVISYILFVIWCSTPATIYWFAGHVAFAPQVGFFVYDILHWTDDESLDVEPDEIDVH